MSKLKQFLQVAAVITVPAWIPSGCEQEYIDHMSQDHIQEFNSKPLPKSVQRFQDAINTGNYAIP